MKWKFWEKRASPSPGVEAWIEKINQERDELWASYGEQELAAILNDESKEERSGFIREMSHKHLTTRGRR